MRQIIAAIGLAAATFSAAACVHPPPLPEKDALEATAILFGYVTGTRFPAYEADLLSGKPGYLEPNFATALARVTVTRSIRGDSTDSIEGWVPCGSPLPNIGEPVVIVRYPGRDRLVRVTVWKNYLRTLSGALVNER